MRLRSHLQVGHLVNDLAALVLFNNHVNIYPSTGLITWYITIIIIYIPSYSDFSVFAVYNSVMY